MLGKILKDVRKNSGLSQKEFGETLSVTQPYISRIERGREKPTKMFIKLFCALYSVDEGSLVDKV